jgi:nicotinate-nucleotide adenylyltransferase
LLGGTFDPPHNGHLALAEAAIRELGLEKVIFIPSKRPPHKSRDIISSKEDRLAMLKLALKKRPEFEISEMEFERKGTSYTIDTLSSFKSAFPREDFCFLLGADNVIEMEGWHEPERIFEMARVAAVNRPGFVPEGRFVSKVDYFEMPEVDISSTMVREKIRHGESIAGLVPIEVEEYISRNNLYGKS